MLTLPFPVSPALPLPPALSVVAIAASQGGVQALSHLLAALPGDFPAAIVIVLHIAPDRKSQIAPILQARTALLVKEAQEGDRLANGLVFTAPPNHHLLMTAKGSLALSSSAKVNFTRPAADPLFVSAAANYGKNAIGVVLTGGRYDGTAGIVAIKEAGGTTIAQDEATSEQFSMPRSAIATGDIDYICPLSEIAPCWSGCAPPNIWPPMYNFR